MSKWLDEHGLEILWELINDRIKKNKLTITKSTNDWDNEYSSYIPENGEIVVYSDYNTTEKDGQTINIPSIKIGDGETPVKQLPFAEKELEKLPHSLTIGDKVYDGSKDVVVDVYAGQVK